MPNHIFVAAVIPGVEILVASQSSGLCSPTLVSQTAVVLLFAFCIHASFLPLELKTEAGLSHLMKMKVAQLYPTLCKPMDYTVHGILQARILEWVAVPFSRGSSQPGIKPRSPAFQVDSLPAELPQRWSTAFCQSAGLEPSSWQ